MALHMNVGGAAEQNGSAACSVSSKLMGRCQSLGRKAAERIGDRMKQVRGCTDRRTVLISVHVLIEMFVLFWGLA